MRHVTDCLQNSFAFSKHRPRQRGNPFETPHSGKHVGGRKCGYAGPLSGGKQEAGYKPASFIDPNTYLIVGPLGVNLPKAPGHLPGCAYAAIVEHAPKPTSITNWATGHDASGIIGDSLSESGKGAED